MSAVTEQISAEIHAFEAAGPAFELLSARFAQLAGTVESDEWTEEAKAEVVQMIECFHGTVRVDPWLMKVSADQERRDLAVSRSVREALASGRDTGFAASELASVHESMRIRNAERAAMSKALAEVVADLEAALR